MTELWTGVRKIFPTYFSKSALWIAEPKRLSGSDDINWLVVTQW